MIEWLHLSECDYPCNICGDIIEPLVPIPVCDPKDVIDLWSGSIAELAAEINWSRRVFGFKFNTLDILKIVESIQKLNLVNSEDCAKSRQDL